MFLFSIFFTCSPNFTISDRIGSFQILLEQTQSFCIEIPTTTLLMFNSPTESFDIEAQMVNTQSLINKPSSPLGFSAFNDTVLMKIALPINNSASLLSFGYFKYYSRYSSYFVVTNAQTQIDFPGLLGIPRETVPRVYFLYLGSIINNITMKISISKMSQCVFHVYNKTQNAPIYTTIYLPGPLSFSSSDYLYYLISNVDSIKRTDEFSSKVELTTTYIPQQEYHGFYAAGKTEFIFSLQPVDYPENKGKILVISLCIVSIVLFIAGAILIYKFCKCRTSIDQEPSVKELDLLQDGIPNK